MFFCFYFRKREDKEFSLKFVQTYNSKNPALDKDVYTERACTVLHK